MRVVQEGGVFWGLGMYASGSTWVFNVLLLVAQALAPDRPRVSKFVSSAADLGNLEAGERLVFVKTHDTDKAAAAALEKVARLIVVSIRDPLDVVASAVQYQRMPFAKALAITEASALQCARFAADKRALLLRYESGFVDDPTTLDRIAARMGGVLAPAERARIFAATRRDEVERYIATIPKKPGVLIHRPTGDLLDPATHWHTHHAGRTGEVGRWRRTLSPEQALQVQTRMRDWMEANFYPTDRVRPAAGGEGDAAQSSQAS